MLYLIISDFKFNKMHILTDIALHVSWFKENKENGVLSIQRYLESVRASFDIDI